MCQAFGQRSFRAIIKLKYIIVYIIVLIFNYLLNTNTTNVYLTLQYFRFIIHRTCINQLYYYLKNLNQILDIIHLTIAHNIHCFYLFLYKGILC